MKQGFKHLLTVLFKHGYYQDNMFKSLDTSFDDGTPKLLRDLDIIIKSFPGGIHLLAANPELLMTTNDDNPIRLLLHSKENLFVNFTDLPDFSPSDHLLYFNNLGNNSVVGSHTFLLHEDETVGQNEMIQLCAGKFQVPLFDHTKKYHFTDAADMEIPPQSIHSINESGEYSLTGMTGNLIKIKEGNSEISRIYYRPNAVWKKPMGILEIYTGRLFNQHLQYGKVDYSIHFKNRQTIWKYFLVNSVYEKFGNLTILNKEKEQVFNIPKKQRVHDNLEALVFESKNKIPISEITNGYYQLVDNYVSPQKPGKLVLKKLPNASPDLIFQDTENPETTYFSHIYI
ncbi:hypothetical protein [Saccharicrinis sp. GN24d3]|uniref:hypothetical protein n=1 Tax=Saccharicrinis sp. GN24d3 TaxID=3458416 RepID=UPI004036B65E